MGFTDKTLVGMRRRIYLSPIDVFMALQLWPRHDPLNRFIESLRGHGDILEAKLLRPSVLMDANRLHTPLPFALVGESSFGSSETSSTISRPSNSSSALSVFSLGIGRAVDAAQALKLWRISS